ncbi:dTDP-4-dehydrorhamnose reductase [Candidatus Steffania adelgidicola]|uniref:dTDP-4-dehydrorhamnose reductase n=1 Tax=Candidatus Steffania adelgidicola TaxID=1076626 RepID=UPI001D016402|nr:dTDP-4-dehydrorhamnose reductase [Candidatus Steffania adelgidicola]UDG79983.1 dTDP-4-dehydrorhamnose reductase [Candidatus Steffania adelgidicola]
MKVLLSGSHGQLGRCFQDRLPAGWGIRATDRYELDITDLAQVNLIASTYLPDVIVNAAAYTAVDKAESEAEIAQAVNKNGTQNLAAVSVKLNVPFFHISTDYVFDGLATKPYSEDMPCFPKNVYGCTKLAGEIAALKINPNTVIIRTSWVFSEYGNNFVKTMLRLGYERQELEVVYDQRSCPTYAGDIAEVIIRMLKAQTIPRGIFHYCGDTVVSWYDFAKAIFFSAQVLGLYDYRVTLKPILTADYPTLASRPIYSVLNTNKILALNLTPSIFKRQLKAVVKIVLS